MSDKSIRLKVTQFGQWVQTHADRLLDGEVENVKIFAHEVARALSSAAIVNIGYKTSTPCRVLGHHIMKRPANRWDHFKLAFFPAWALAKWPPRMTETEIEIMELFPALKLPPPIKPDERGRVFYIYEKTLPTLEGDDE